MMTCKIVFDFHSPHNNEYWYKCETCGASDWFAYYDKPKIDQPLKGCNPRNKLKNLKFGDIVYLVNEQNNAFQKKKIVKVDRKGVEWFRYDRDHWEWSISEIVYCGKVTMVTEGEVDLDLDRQDQMHFKYPDGNIYYEYVSLIHENENLFTTREEAEAYIEQQKLIKNK